MQIDDPLLATTFRYLVRVFVSYLIFRITTKGLDRRNLNDYSDYGRWLSGFFIAFFIFHSLGKYFSGYYADSGEMILQIWIVSIAICIFSYLIGSIISLLKPNISFFKPKRINKKTSKVPTFYWELALNEFEDERNIGVWSECIYNCNGNEEKAKALYLKVRSREIFDNHQINANENA